jgi:multiple sugar transport system substrate-binding protein
MVKLHKRPLLALSTLAAATLVLTGCATSSGTTTSGSTAKVSASAIAKAMNTPTTITFWTWVPKIQTEVNLFEKKYPKVKVKVVNLGQGDTYYTKLESAITAKSGAPDVAQVEYTHIPSFELGQNLVDLAPYGASSIKSQFSPSAWSLVSSGSKVYGIPQDSGPLGLLYREDILKKDGVAAPQTWSQFATAAAAVHKADPSQYLADIPSANGSAFLGLFQQAGANPFSYDGKKTVNINLDSAAGKKVVNYWSGLIQKGDVSTDPDFTDSWYQGFSSGKYASWIAAAWGPVFLQGTAAKTSGLWRAAPLPQWTAGQQESGIVGGSADSVLSSSKHKIASAVFSQFLNSDKQSTLDFATQQFLFPTTKSTLASPSFSDQKSPFYGGQQVNKVFAGISNKITTSFGSLPFMDYVYDSFNTTLGKAMANGGTGMDAGLAAWQASVVKYAKSQGFTVTTK